EADRMGYRLEGPPIKHKAKADVVSDALLPGAIQVPKNGKLIIIMRTPKQLVAIQKLLLPQRPTFPRLGKRSQTTL
ncbi:MAG: hypothetical protein QME50_00715, partial [Candidatus Bathyarchaeota archaeon]|nr:hypothetical protein [Candidatus Bathyarchaeota archaeon]